MNSWLLGLVFVLGGLAGVGLLVVPLTRREGPRAKPGTFKVKKNLYTYEIGDMLLRIAGESVFSGVDVHLGKRLPHIFVDSYIGEEVAHPEGYVLAGDERVQLKHDIDQHVQVYVAKGFDNLARKIFTSQVLDKLMDAAFRYDIEIVDRHIRLVVPTNVPVVGVNQAMQHDLLKIAKLLTEQVDHILEKWDESRLAQATKKQ